MVAGTTQSSLSNVAVRCRHINQTQISVCFYAFQGKNPSVEIMKCRKEIVKMVESVIILNNRCQGLRPRSTRCIRKQMSDRVDKSKA